MEITIREKNQGPSVNIKKNNEEVLNSANPVAAAPEPVEEVVEEKPLAPKTALGAEAEIKKVG